MSIVKKSDVKNHLSPRNHRGIHLFRPESEPDATGYSGAEPAHSDPHPERTGQQPHADRPAATPVEAAHDPNALAVSAAPKSVGV